MTIVLLLIAVNVIFELFVIDILLLPFANVPIKLAAIALPATVNNGVCNNPFPVVKVNPPLPVNNPLVLN